MENLVKAEILDVCPTPYGYAAFVRAAGKIFVIHINRMRGMSLQYAKENRKGERPFTHEFILQLLDGLDCSVSKVVIYHVDDGTFYTKMIVEMDNEVSQKIVEIDARPSDTISVALRSGAPVFVTHDVLGKVEDITETYRKIKGE